MALILSDAAEIAEQSGDALLFKCDGKYRSKLGFPPQLTPWVAGSYDADRKILTIITFDVDREGDYVNSKWKIQEEPYKGDAFNTYNDGPLADGTQLGPFYELESSSPVFPLKPYETQIYSQVTAHFEGDFAREFLWLPKASLSGRAFAPS